MLCQNVRDVYYSPLIRNLVSKVAKTLLDFPENQIFPVLNYTQQIELDDDIDTLLLYTLREMIRGKVSYTVELLNS
jgi:hypothetical protein